MDSANPSASADEADVAPVTKATPPLAELTLNLNVVPVGVTRVQAPSPSWTANQSGVSPAVQNSHVVLPVPLVTAVTVTASVAVCSVMPLAFPRTVTVVGPPVVAFAAAVSVSVDVAVVGAAGSKDAVTPLGRPVAVSVTAPAKPFVRVIVTVDVVLPPCCTVAVVGASDSVNPPADVAAVMVSWNVAVLAVCPVAVLVTVTVVGPPTVAFAAACSVMVDVEDVPGMLAGVSAPVTPIGSPASSRAPAPANPPVLVSVTATLPFAPCARLVVAGATAIV